MNRHWLLGAALPLSLLACSSILGFEPLTLDDNVGDGGARDGASVNDGSSSDATAGDDGGSDGGVDASDDADGAACNAIFDTDPKNCGRCGHDCGGGDCKGGVCQPGKLADSLGIPLGIVVDDKNVFVAEYDTNRIISFDKSKVPGKCSSISSLVSCVFADQPGTLRPYAMAIDADNVYWSNAASGDPGEIRACPRTGCGGGGPRLVATLVTDAYTTDIKVANGFLYWAENQGSAIRRALPDGGAKLTLLASSSYSPLHLAVDDTSVFFTEDGNNQPGPTSIRAVQVDGGGGAPRAVAEADAKTHGLALTDAGELYWTVPIVGGVGDGVVAHAPKTSTGQKPASSFASNQVEPSAIVVDETNVYWLESGSDNVADGMLVMCPLAGCPATGPIVLAEKQAYPRHLTQDDTALYWSNEGLSTSTSYDGQVWKIAKP